MNPKNKYKDAGRTWEDVAMQKKSAERHDREHPFEPELYQGECLICAERVEQKKAATR